MIGLVAYESAKRIKIKCDLLCQPLPVNYKLDEDNKEVILIPLLDKRIEHFEIPGYITIIDDWAFQNCFKVQEVIIPGLVKSIGEGAFHNCISLQSIKLPDSLTVIADQTFAGCTSLEKIEFGSNIREIGNWAFSRSRITKDMMPDTVKIVSDLAFDYY